MYTCRALAPQDKACDHLHGHAHVQVPSPAGLSRSWPGSMMTGTVPGMGIRLPSIFWEQRTSAILFSGCEAPRPQERAPLIVHPHRTLSYW